MSVDNFYKLFHFPTIKFCGKLWKTLFKPVFSGFEEFLFVETLFVRYFHKKKHIVFAIICIARRLKT